MGHQSTATRTAWLGDQEVTIGRLGTRAGLRVARKLLGYVTLWQEFEDIVKAAQYEGEDQRDVRVAAGAKTLRTLSEKLEQDDLLELLANLIGQDIDVVGDAPLEDTFDAIAVALEINDIGALLRSATGVFTAGQNLVTRMRGEAKPKAVPAANRQQRRAATPKRR